MSARLAPRRQSTSIVWTVKPKGISDIGPASRERTANDDDDLVARGSQVYDGGFHRAGSRRSQEDDISRCSEERPATGLQFGQEFLHLWRAVIEQRPVAGARTASGTCIGPGRNNSGCLMEIKTPFNTKYDHINYTCGFSPLCRARFGLAILEY